MDGDFGEDADGFAQQCAALVTNALEAYDAALDSADASAADAEGATASTAVRARKRSQLARDCAEALFDSHALQLQRLRAEARQRFTASLQGLRVTSGLPREMEAGMKEVGKWFQGRAKKLRPGCVAPSAWTHKRVGAQIASELRELSTEVLQQQRLRGSYQPSQSKIPGGPIAMSFHYLMQQPFGVTEARQEQLGLSGYSFGKRSLAEATPDAPALTGLKIKSQAPPADLDAMIYSPGDK